LENNSEFSKVLSCSQEKRELRNELTLYQQIVNTDKKPKPSLRNNPMTASVDVK
jgi:hypothetical protein